MDYKRGNVIGRGNGQFPQELRYQPVEVLRPDCPIKNIVEERFGNGGKKSCASTIQG